MSVSLFVALIGVLLIIVVLVLFLPSPRLWKETRTPVSRGSFSPIDRDDNRYWYVGLFYNNPRDPDLVVPKRYGFGWTLNFGNPKSRFIIIGILLLPIVMLVLNVLLFGTSPIGCHLSGCYPAP